jgi:amidophosphoribosyltransferase
MGGLADPSCDHEGVTPPASGATDDSPREACGVFGLAATGQPVAHLTFLGLYALQHRGQESAGMSVSDGEQITVVKDMGLVSNVFSDRTLAPLTGHLAIGHTRYSTSGSSTWRNAQPVFRSVGQCEFALGHNGNLVNTDKLAAELGMLPGVVTSDSDLIAELLEAELRLLDADADADAGAAAGDDGAGPDGPAVASPPPLPPSSPLEVALMRVLPRLEGAFSLVLMDADRVIGVRDPNGLRPLCLGALEHPPPVAGAGTGTGTASGWVVASESPALDIVGARFEREVEPGEMVVVSPTGVTSARPFPAERIRPRLCLFEFVYFARPDARLYDQSVHHARVRQGEMLAEQAPLPADTRWPEAECMVMGVPESGVPAAEGYARASGIPFGHGLVKNRYIGRTFIAPTQEMRALGVRMKFNPLRDSVAGKRLVVVDDSIVRGTTQRQLVKMLREAGTLEVHLRLTSPPVRWPCFYGMDFGDTNELLAANRSVEEIADYLNVDSLAYIDIDRLRASTGADHRGFCDACFTGNYPIEVPVELGKGRLEGPGVSDVEGGTSASATALIEEAALLPADEARRVR